MKIAIIGGGIYGCHLASVLIEYGIDVKIYEKENDIFRWASGNNQFRLHLGYHYARDYKTRQQSKLGFDKFLVTYKDFTTQIDENLYIIPKLNSLIDFKTYLSIFRHEGFEFDLLSHNDDKGLINIDGIIRVHERIVCVQQLKTHFLHLLEGRINTNTEITNETITAFAAEHDYVIDCTWGRLSETENQFFEVTHLAYCRNLTGKPHPALTFVDGDLWSLYPTEKEAIFTLSSVPFTPLFRSGQYKEAEQFIRNLSKEVLAANFQKMADDVLQYYPEFFDNFSYIEDQVSIKTKIKGSNAPRDCRVWIEEGNIIRVLSGKIDTLYIAEEFILNEIL